MSIPVETNIWINEVFDEGFKYCDGFFVSFWWVLNQEWYKMNDKLFAYTGCEEPYVEPRDFDDYSFTK
jgi:hypothetical protein